MKKLLTLMAIFTIALTSCNKDNEPEIQTLDGTSWNSKFKSHIEESGVSLDIMASVGFIFEKDIVKAKIGAAAIIDGKTTPYKYITRNGTYTYNPPKVSITINGETSEGTISGNKMNLIDEGKEIILTKE
ncbi:MAG: hypothetical protein IMY73_02515 [Bacteroidetes bacterium]|nr:hypothetical protein [Bacteroidota bacterium]